MRWTVQCHLSSQSSTLLQIFSGINGLLIPGGAVSIRDSPYAEASQTMFQLAMAANDEGDVFPIWGTCLGFEMLGSITNNLEPYLKSCNSYDQVSESTQLYPCYTIIDHYLVFTFGAGRWLGDE